MLSELVERSFLIIIVSNVFYIYFVSVCVYIIFFVYICSGVCDAMVAAVRRIMYCE